MTVVPEVPGILTADQCAATGAAIAAIAGLLLPEMKGRLID